MYRIGERRKDRRKQAVKAVLITFGVLILTVGAYAILRQFLQPDAMITQSAAITRVVNYDNQTKKYDEPNFTIELPSSWSVINRPKGQYTSYAWQSSNRVTDGQIIEIYEDTIPVNYAVNKVLVVTSNGDRVSHDGSVSDNCLSFTKNDKTVVYQVGTAARWKGVSFWCDQNNTQRDVVGTSSSDGVNVVILRNESSGNTHKYFFTYTNHAISPDYSPFYSAIESFRLK